MSKFLVHIHTGPADPTKATLGCLVALTAAREGHEVSVFLAGAGVHLLAPRNVESVEGLGTGKLSDHLPALRDLGVRFYVSGMSAKARGYEKDLLDGWLAEYAMPDVLVRLADEADTVLCY